MLEIPNRKVKLLLKKQYRQVHSGSKVVMYSTAVRKENEGRTESFQIKAFG